MKAIIVDDDITSIKSLEYLCAKLEGVEIEACFQDAVSALQFLRKNPIDVLFLDIEMPDFSGIDLVKTVPNLPQVIFTSGNKEYALEAFDYDVTDYITKPITLPRLQKAIDKVNKYTQTENSADSDYLFVKTEGRLVKLNIDKILYIETLGDYVVFKTIDGKGHVVYSTLKALDAKIRSKLFVKVHRSYIVNVSKIVDIEENNLVIADKVIPISRAHKADLLAKINAIR
jgi:DNA-binding LytR/AlgR family response regulator